MARGTDLFQSRLTLQTTVDIFITPPKNECSVTIFGVDFQRPRFASSGRTIAWSRPKNIATEIGVIGDPTSGETQTKPLNEFFANR